MSILLGLMTIGAMPDDPAAIVARLHPDEPSVRALAANEVRGLGNKSIPELAEAARSTEDPIERDRILELWRAIVPGDLTRPTPMPSSLRDWSEERIGAFASIMGPLRALGDAPERDAIRPIEGEEPLTFWESIGRLQEDRGLTINVEGRSPFAPSDLSLRVYGLDSGVRLANEGKGRIDASGPFRVTLETLTHHRLLRLDTGPGIDVDRFNQRLESPGTAVMDRLSERFEATLRVEVEPRMLFAQVDRARVVEAIDDRGQSLRPSQGREPPEVRVSGGGALEHRITLALRYPAQAGSRIKQLRAVVPVVLEVIEPVPALTIPMEEADGRTFTHGALRFEVDRVGSGDEFGLAVIDARIDLERSGLPGLEHPGVISGWGMDLLHYQFVLIDDRGMAVSRGGTGGASPDGRARINLSSRVREGVRPAVALHYYPMVRKAADLAFEFVDLPMP